MRGRPENVAAAVNGLLVLLLPPALLVAGSVLLDPSSNTSVRVRAPGEPRVVPALLTFLQMGWRLLPFAALAAWRTWVYARRWQSGHAGGWPGVAEAGACGLVTALILLAPGIVMRTAEAPPYVVVYGGAALILGIVAGLVLRMTALLVLQLHR